MQQDDFYNILTDDPPKSVNVNGVNYPVRTNFKDWILFFFLHEDVDLTDIERSRYPWTGILTLYRRKKVAAYQALQKFAACDRMPKSKEKQQWYDVPLFFRIYTTAHTCLLTF